MNLSNRKAVRAWLPIVPTQWILTIPTALTVVQDTPFRMQAVPLVLQDVPAI